jgi:hypothetical protein
MLRPALFSAFLAFALQLSQAQLIGHGAPASVTSPTADGQLHGVPSSVVSPTQRSSGTVRPVFRPHGQLRRFGSVHARRPVVVPLPVFYPIYNDGGDPSSSVADPSVPQSQGDPGSDAAPDSDRSEDALRDAYLQGARDAMARQDQARQEQTRYGEHYLDSREKQRSQPPAAKKQPRRDDEDSNAAAPAPVEDKSPAAVFIFKDGHQIETRNFAIMGQSLFDFSSKSLRKIQLDEIDSAATLKANDDRGISVKLP